MQHRLFLLFTLLGFQLVAAPWIIHEGNANAEIIIAESAPPMVRLAAQELATTLETMSGAALPIVQAPGDAAVHLYIGESKWTRELGVSSEGLQHGAYHLRSGDSWLAMVGVDTPFQPNALKELARYPKETPEKARFWEEWYAASGGEWGVPYEQLWKTDNAAFGISEYDQRGSFNAVCDVLRRLGVRWFLPDPLGTVIPQSASIALPELDETVVPDFPYRHPYQYGKRFRTNNLEEVLWQLRLGFNQAPDLMDVGYIAHGINFITGRVGLCAHPRAKVRPDEFYALVNGKRLTGEDKGGNGKQCLSSEALFRENVAFVRAMYDHLDAPTISVMPADGFVSICQCAPCQAQIQPERGWRGQYSNYVWTYVDRVAREVYKTHPDRTVVCLAYGTFLHPPDNLEALSPNILVSIAQYRGRFANEGEYYEKYQRLRKEWAALLPDDGKRRLLIYDYYLSTRPGKTFEAMPSFYPHTIARDLRQLSGISLGDYIEVYRDKDLDDLSITSLNLWLTSRLWWDAEQDADALLADYCRNFYGPAAEQMLALITWSEEHFLEMKQPDVIDTFFQLLATAEAKVEPGTVYAKRLALLSKYVAPLHDLREQLLKGRDDVPVMQIIRRKAEDIVMDGRLDDVFWQVPGAGRGELREIHTGREAIAPTYIRGAMSGDNIYFSIRCEEPDMSTLKDAATGPDDANIWEGDAVEIELETPSHAYYQIAISPSGHVMDLDRADGINTLWESNIEVATHRDDAGWNLEVRIPVAGATQGDIDPLNGVAGDLPSKTFPWYFNICRQRPRETGSENSAYSPTGENGFHIPQKFARLEPKF